MDSHIKNHMKHVDLIGLCIQLSKSQTQSGLALAYLITKDLYREWVGTLESIKKECSRDYQDISAQETYGIILEEVDYMRGALEMYEQEITKWNIESL